METQDNLTGIEFAAQMNAQQGVSQTPDGTVKEKPPIQLYIIKTKISNENFVLESKDVNDKQKLFTYKFAKETRDKIKAIRMKHKSPIYNSTLDFYGLHVCGDDSRPFIQKAIDAAEVDFKTLRMEYIQKLMVNAPETGQIINQETADKLVPHLGAKVLFIPLDFQQIFKGNIYGQISDAIQYQVYSGLFARMETMLKRTEEGKELPERSRNALIKMVDSLNSINVTKDENITQKLADIRSKIVDGNLKEVAASLKQELDAGKSRWAAIEL